MRPFFPSLALLSLSLSAVKAGFPSKIYGVNLGSWLLLEPWMLPAEWVAMGGERCDNACSTCIASEYAFVKAHGQKYSDHKFNEHWTTWFTQDDVHRFQELGINTVRVPLGYWIIEDLVDRTTEFYPRGGLAQLRRGLKQLKKAGIAVVLDHHALPGVQDPGQQFAGRCTDDVQFYTPYNYHRALVWTAVMTTLSHVDPVFSNVVGIEAMNEPIMNSSLTPGYGNFQKNFVQVVRAVEFLLGIPVTGLEVSTQITIFPNVTLSLGTAGQFPLFFSKRVCAALEESIPILLKLGAQIPLVDLFTFSPAKRREPLTTTFMDIGWQWGNPSNPADAAMGPQIYDNHLYYSFGGVADANETAYLISICNLDRIEKDAALGNSPLFFGEWGLPTQFNATDEFLCKWADAQKYSYSKGAGWLFWNFKVEISEAAGDLARQWSYFEGVRRGYLTEDPSKLLDPHVCDPYIGATYTPPPSTSTSAPASSSAPTPSASPSPSPSPTPFASPSPSPTPSASPSPSRPPSLSPST